MTDPISDFLTRLRNAGKARLEQCAAPHSGLKEGIAAILKAEGAHKIMTASDGNEALRLMEDPRHPFDVVFLDLNLPMISGLDLLERVRATREEPVVAEKLAGD